MRLSVFAIRGHMIGGTAPLHCSSVNMFGRLTGPIDPILGRYQIPECGIPTLIPVSVLNMALESWCRVYRHLKGMKVHG